MYNQNFLDAMDRVNNIAKSMGYQNGVAWARKQKEDGRISEYIYEIFNDCHSLRNLMAHGYSADINITLQTMQKVQSLVETISNSSNKTAFGNAQQIGFSSYNELEIQMGDYVVAPGGISRIYSNSHEWHNVCTTFKVVDIDKTSVILKDINTGELFDVDKLRRHSKVEVRHGLYVIRTNFASYDVPKNKPMYVIKEPTFAGGVGGASFLYVTLLKNYDYERLGTLRFNDNNVVKMSVKGYLADIDCLDKTKSKRLYDMKDGDKQGYRDDDLLF